ncbi:DUF302 domain-containing protein [Streptomyces durbertensis]|uniref:DUF302 domain-containing protein n=1 Tax=Streptomyces durbertensis TaxID=2448886 RepID=A0ABR6EAZ2_9ACTN|nr:DUF302 domain-containing protein [Streptomyces durbertensis]MBB1242493.1 DUF302 domain-containing protein [Streptomyces durbertensis]
MRYDRTVLLRSDFPTTVTAVREALGDQGFGVLTEIDVPDVLRSKLGPEAPADLDGYLILGACNPRLAMRALEVDPTVGLLLPCNVVVRTTPDGTLVQALDPNALVTVTGLDGLRAVAHEATARLDAALGALAREHG